jgi:hypothetical protein
VITPEYQALLQEQHRTTDWGALDTFRHMNELQILMDKTQSKTILDFGSGREALRKHVEKSKRSWEVAQYDPGQPKRTVLPDGPFDVVVSCDVLEHVERVFLMNTLAAIYTRATKGIYLVIACRQAKATLADGSNAHLIVQRPEWWLARLMARNVHHGFEVDFMVAHQGKELRVSMVKNATP